MPSAFSLLRDAWAFFRRTPALTHVLLFLLTLPGAALTILVRLSSEDPLRAALPFALPRSPSTLFLLAPGYLLIMLVMIWGSASVLVAGRRMSQSRAGRSRTSFAALRKEGAQFVVPLLLTEILRSCFTILWGLLLIVPGILYMIRTTLYAVVVVNEEIDCREALARSKELVRGRMRMLLWRILLLTFMLFIPAAIIAEIAEIALTSANPSTIILSDLLGSLFMSFATLLFLLALTGFYGALKRQPREVRI